MDLRDFFRTIREIEAQLEDPHIVIVSVATSDGGKAGVHTEVPRNLAARIVAEGKARLATPDEAWSFRERIQHQVEAAEKAALAEKLQVALVSDLDIETLRQSVRPRKG
jgi:hypothetical protein